MNRNVRLAFVLSVFSGLASSVYSGTVETAYLWNLTGGSNAQVGVILMLGGLSGLLVAYPAGLAADKLGRAGVIRLGGVAEIAAFAVTVSALLSGSSGSPYLLFCVGEVLAGLAGQIISGPVDALLADSMPEGERSGGYAWLWVANLLPSCVGPLICVVLFLRLGNDWGQPVLRLVFLAGLGLQVPVMLLMFLFRDEPEPAAGSEDSEASLRASEDGGGTPAAAEAGRTGFGGLRQAHIPYIIFASDLISALGSGMTVKYFPLYFRNAVGLRPADVQAVFAVQPALMAAFVLLSQKLSLAAGRVPCVLLCKALGVGCLAAMVYLAEVSKCEDWQVMVPLFLARTSFANCSGPLEESILMDNVPRGTRARWKSLDSIHDVGWCGSAWLGGWVADRFRSNGHSGYVYTFALTAAMQCIGGLLFALLLPLVKSEKREENEKEKEEPAPALAGERAPLLGAAAAADVEQ